MHGSFTSERHKLAVLSFFSLVISFLIACGGSSADQEAALRSDRPAGELITRIDQTIARGMPVRAEDVEALWSLHEKYPKAETVRRSLKNVLVAKDDLRSLERLLTERPIDELPTEERKMLGMLYVKMGNFGRALVIMEPLVAEAPSDVDINLSIGLAYFYQDMPDEAGIAFDRVWDEIRSEKKFSEMTMRGIIHLRKNELEKALEVLNESYAIAPDHVATNNALSRTYARLGNEKQAEFFRRQTVEGQDALVDSKYRASLTVKRIHDLESAWSKKEYSQVAMIARELIPGSSREQKIVLYQYLFEASKALGNEAAAEAAVAEIQKLKNQK